MIHLYKAGGEWATADGKKYTIKAFSHADAKTKLSDGWFRTLNECFSDESVDGGSYERELRDKIKALGGKAGGRASIETLENTLAKLESGSDNEADSH